MAELLASAAWTLVSPAYHHFAIGNRSSIGIHAHKKRMAIVGRHGDESYVGKYSLCPTAEYIYIYKDI